MDIPISWKRLGAVRPPCALDTRNRRPKKGDIEARYSTMKQIPLQMIEEMRASYGKCEVLLSTFTQAVDQLSTFGELQIEC